MFQCDIFADTSFVLHSHVGRSEQASEREREQHSRWIENFKLKSTFDLSQCWKKIPMRTCETIAIRAKPFRCSPISMMILYCTTKMDFFYFRLCLGALHRAQQQQQQWYHHQQHQQQCSMKIHSLPYFLLRRRNKIAGGQTE